MTAVIPAVIAALALGAVVGYMLGHRDADRQVADVQTKLDTAIETWQENWATWTRDNTNLEADLERAERQSDTWKTQAETLVSQNTRLLDEVAAARLQLGDSADKILAAFTSPGTNGDTSSEQAGTSPMQLVDDALTAAFDLNEPDWTENLPYTGGTPTQSTTPPEVVAGIEPAEGGN